MEEKVYTPPTIYTIKVERSPSLVAASSGSSVNVKPDTGEDLSGGGDGDASGGL